MGYAWSLDFGWFWLEVRKPEHGIPHVHGCSTECEVVLSIEGQAILEIPIGYRASDIKLIQAEVKKRQIELLAKWRELNG